MSAGRTPCADYDRCLVCFEEGGHRPDEDTGAGPIVGRIYHVMTDSGALLVRDAVCETVFEMDDGRVGARVAGFDPTTDAPLAFHALVAGKEWIEVPPVDLGALLLSTDAA